MSKIVIWFASSLLIFSLLVQLSSNSVYALNEYTVAQVAQHNKNSDCWMIFDSKVYDITNYLRSHDKYMDIRSWCGNDMTQDFKDKAGMGVDHKQSSYSLLAAYQIGQVASTSVTSTVTPTTALATTVAPTSSSEDAEFSVEIEGSELKALTIQQIADLWKIDATTLLNQIISKFGLKGSYTTQTILDSIRTEYKFSPAQIKEIAEAIKVNGVITTLSPTVSQTPTQATTSDPYNFFAIFISTLSLYLFSYYLSKRNFKWFTIPTFNLVWNTVLVLALIPSAVFGFYLALRYSFPVLNQVDFDFMFWHVEGSIIFATICVAHFIKRLKQYILPVKLLSLKKA